MTTRRWAAALLALCGSASLASGHGGNYQPPPGDGGGGGQPPAGGGPGGGGGPGKGPTTGGGSLGGPPSGGGPGPGPVTGGGTPPTTGGPGAGPTTGGAPFAGTGPTRPPRPPGQAGVDPDHWTRWWYANRNLVLDLEARATRRGAAETPGAREAPVEAELWRAEAQRVLSESLTDADEDVASAAAIALGKAGDPAEGPGLLRVLRDRKRQQPVREAAALALGLLPPQGDPYADTTRRALEELASSEREPDRLRAVAVYALGLRRDAAAVPFLLDAAWSGGGTWDLPAAGSSALGLCGVQMARTDLEEILAGPRARKRHESMRRVYAAQGLARLADPAAVPALREAARDDDENVRRAALLALGVLADPADSDTTDLLIRVLNRDRDRAACNMAALSLARIGSDRAASALRHAYEKGDGLHQPFAALGLGLLARRSGNTGLAQVLHRDLETRANADLRGALAIAVGLSGLTEAAPTLRSIVGDRGDPEVRAHAALALGLLGDREAAPPLLRKVLRDANDPTLQRETALALGLLGDRESVALLVDLVERGTSLYSQASAAVALGRIGGRESAGALSKLLADRSRPGLGRGMAAVGLGLLLDRTEGRGLARVGADLNWYALTSTVEEILTIL